MTCILKIFCRFRVSPRASGCYSISGRPVCPLPSTRPAFPQRRHRAPARLDSTCMQLQVTGRDRRRRPRQAASPRLGREEEPRRMGRGGGHNQSFPHLPKPGKKEKRQRHVDKNGGCARCVRAKHGAIGSARLWLGAPPRRTKRELNKKEGAEEWLDGLGWQGGDARCTAAAPVPWLH